MQVCRVALKDVSVAVVIGTLCSVPLGLLAMAYAPRIVPDFDGATTSVVTAMLLVGAVVCMSITTLLPKVLRVDPVMCLRGQ